MQERKNPPGRRAMLGGAAAAGTAAVVASLVPLRPQAPDAVARGPAGPQDAAEGYRLTDHVKSYYAKARI